MAEPKGYELIQMKLKKTAAAVRMSGGQLKEQSGNSQIRCISSKTSFKIHRRGILKLNPDVSRKHIHRNPRERWHPDVSSTNKNMIVLLLKTKT